MKVIIAGSRSVTSMEVLKETIKNSGFEITEVVCGLADGADMLGHDYCIETGIKIKCFPAKWDDYGKSAGYKRNKEMAEYGDALIALWDCSSKGTNHMIDLAKEHNLKIHISKVGICTDCSELLYEPPGQDCPYQQFLCLKGNWDIPESIDSLNMQIICEDFKPK